MRLLILASMILSSFPASAQEDEKVKVLEQKVLMLEQRVAHLEGQMRYLPRADETSAGKKMQKVAEERVASDRKKYKTHEIEHAEAMYMRASRNSDTPASRMTLDSIVAGYPHLNRAGCAQLYRAQQETGVKKERLLLDCIERFADCYYLDGAQVGPLAMFQLAQQYGSFGKPDEAEKIFRRIRKEHRQAVNHRGELLTSLID